MHGSEPAPGSGSVMQKQERTSPLASGPQPAFLLRRRRHRLEQMHVAFVGREDVERERAERRVAGFLENDCLGVVVEAEPAVFA